MIFVLNLDYLSFKYIIRLIRALTRSFVDFFVVRVEKSAAFMYICMTNICNIMDLATRKYNFRRVIRQKFSLRLQQSW